jgi:hypothetical protein
VSRERRRRRRIGEPVNFHRFDGVDAHVVALLEGKVPEPAVAPDEAGNEVADRRPQDLLRRGVLGEDPANGKDGNLVAEDRRLIDVVGDEDDRLGEVALQAQQLLLEFPAGPPDRQR